MNFQTRLTPYLRRSRHDGQQAIAELQGSTLGATYLTGLQIDEMLARYSSAGDKTYLTDVLGSITAQTDATGAITQRYSYSAYGETQGNPQTTATDPNSVQYTGRENDGTGLYYYRARYYDPQLKRFTQSDPIGLNGGINEFGYVRGNPLSKIDPLGLWSLSISGYVGWGGGVELTGSGLDIQSIGFMGGVGLGGGISINPWGSRPDSNSPCNSNSIGVYAQANAGIPGIDVGAGVNYGGTQAINAQGQVNWQGYGGWDPEFAGSHGSGGVPLHFGTFGIELGVSAGVQMTHNF